jgi:hypothetical protein
MAFVRFRQNEPIRFLNREVATAGDFRSARRFRVGFCNSRSGGVNFVAQTIARRCGIDTGEFGMRGTPQITPVGREA